MYTLFISGPNLQPNIVSDNSSYKHVLSRQSPYPKTTVQRFPVFTKYVSWEVNIFIL